MKLLSAHITNFRSVEDSGEFSVGQVTSLVGKNEAGKSAVLLALAALNPNAATPAVLDKERDYPRRFLVQYAQRHPKENAVAVSTKWQLSDDELESIKAELGDGVVTSPVVTVFRRYLAQAPEWNVAVDYKRAIRNAVDGAEFDEAVKATLVTAENTEALIKQLSALLSPTADQQKLLTRVKGYGSFTDFVKSKLAVSLPTFLYFSNYDRMDGAVQFEQLAQLKANGQINNEDKRGARLFMEFLTYAGGSRRRHTGNGNVRDLQCEAASRVEQHYRSNSGVLDAESGSLRYRDNRSLASAGSTSVQCWHNWARANLQSTAPR